MRKVLLLFVAVTTVIGGMWLAFPVSALESIIEGSVQDPDFAIRMEGLRKGLFYRLDADRIALTYRGSELIAFHSVHAHMNPLHLILLRVKISFHGSLGGGSFSGSALLAPKTGTIHLTFGQAALCDMHFLKIAGVRGTGTLSGNMTMTDRKGHMEFLVTDAEIEPVHMSGAFIPLNFFRTVQGAFRVEGKTVDIASVSFEGPAIFARLRGVIRDSRMDLHMELMPDKVFLDNPLFVSQVERYRVSPGYYMIPLKGPIVL